MNALLTRRLNIHWLVDFFWVLLQGISFFRPQGWKKEMPKRRNQKKSEDRHIVFTLLTIITHNWLDIAAYWRGTAEKKIFLNIIRKMAKCSEYSLLLRTSSQSNMGLRIYYKLNLLFVGVWDKGWKLVILVPLILGTILERNRLICYWSAH